MEKTRRSHRRHENRQERTWGATPPRGRETTIPSLGLRLRRRSNKQGTVETLSLGPILTFAGPCCTHVRARDGVNPPAPVAAEAGAPATLALCVAAGDVPARGTAGGDGGSIHGWVAGGGWSTGEEEEASKEGRVFQAKLMPPPTSGGKWGSSTGG